MSTLGKMKQMEYINSSAEKAWIHFINDVLAAVTFVFAYAPYSCYCCNLPTKARARLEHTGCMQSAKASNSKCIYFILEVKAREVILALR